MTPGRINIRDVGTNFIYNGVGVVGSTDSQGPTNQRFSASYVTGAHIFKVGVLASETVRHYLAGTDRGTIPFTYTFNNGTPTGLTIFVSPLLQPAAQRLGLGLFGQDQWRMRRLTLNLGLRYEYSNAYAPALQREAGPLQDAASFPEVDCLPCWHDIYPRVGAVVDVFGDSKTAVKVNIGLYGAAITTGWAEVFRPVTAAVNTTTRSWVDGNGNFYPECDLRNPLANGECGPDANQTFGQLQIRTRPAPGFMTGWGNRGYNWQTSLSVDHQPRLSVALNAGYYRTWFGNFTVVDNLAVTPADYDPYCVTAPTDPRLGATSAGSRSAGVRHQAGEIRRGRQHHRAGKNYGKMTEEYNGRCRRQRSLPGAQLRAVGTSATRSACLRAAAGRYPTRSVDASSSIRLQQLFNCETGKPVSAPVQAECLGPMPESAGCRRLSVSCRGLYGVQRREWEVRPAPRVSVAERPPVTAAARC